MKANEWTIPASKMKTKTEFSLPLPHQVIEAILAHKEQNLIKAAYNRSNYKKAMRGLIEWYANYLEEIKNG